MDHNQRKALWTGLFLLAMLAAVAGISAAQTADDPVVARIIELGRQDNRTMTWIDIATNRFGGRYTGSDTYTNAAVWAAWQFRQWGLPAELDEAGEVPVGFNRGPWSGRMVQPSEKALYFSTPSYTAGTRGIQRGPAVMAPAKEEEVDGMKEALRGAWVLLPKESDGMARDGRREYKMPPLVQKMYEAGILGTIQPAKEPFRMMNGTTPSWEELPVLPDIKLDDAQYQEIKALVEKGERVELEFDIRNWFKMGPVKYHSVVAWIRGTDFPDEWVVMGGHLDCYDAATGAVDNASGFGPGMEAMRLLQAAGAKPKRSIMMILFAAEENGILGADAFLRRRPGLEGRITAMINRDGGPSAITGARVPASWYGEFERFTAPLKNLNPDFPFELIRDDYPRVRSERLAGSDSSAFSMRGVPTLSLSSKTDYNYGRAWHTLHDTYNELVPYAGHLRHTAVVQAVLAYGLANLNTLLSREGLFLPDGLYADLTTAKGRLIVSLDYTTNPLFTAQFIRLLEGVPKKDGAPPAPAFNPGQRQEEPPPIGKVMAVKDGTVQLVIESDVQKSLPAVELPWPAPSAEAFSQAGIFGLISANGVLITAGPVTGELKPAVPLGKVIAGGDVVRALQPGDAWSRGRIVRVGDAAKNFKTDEESFQALLKKAQESAAPKKGGKKSR